MIEQHQRIVLPAPRVRSLCWHGDELVDWVGGGTRYFLDGSTVRGGVNFAYRFDAAAVSPSGRYVVIYERLGTKGIVWDAEAGRLLRELNRSFYHAHAYEYPVALLALPDGREIVAHCPDEYNRLQLDDLATGERLSGRETKSPDFFHSRLSISPSGAWLLSAGWVWHPFDSLCLYRIADVLARPEALDDWHGWGESVPTHDGPVSSAAFLEPDLLLMSSAKDGDNLGNEDPDALCLRPGTVAVYNLAERRYISIGPLEDEAGTLMPLGADHVIGFYDHPKLIHLPTGRVLHRWPDLKTGHQNSSILLGQQDPLPPLALDPTRRRFAVADDETITVVIFR